MKASINSAVKVLAAAAMIAAASSASAQSAGKWTAEFGLAEITPKVKSGNVSAPALPGTKADIGADTKPVFSFGYGLSDKLALKLELGIPFKHTIYGAGAIQGTGELGTIKVLPPTALVQYRFLQPDARVRPYLGIGATYAYFTDETGSGRMTALTNVGGAPVTFSMKNKLAATAQVGASVNINERWFADLALYKTLLKTKATFSTGQTQDITLDPQTVRLAVGYKF